MAQKKAVSWNIKVQMLCIAMGVQLLLLSSSSYAQSSAPLAGTSKGDLHTDLTTNQPPASYTSISTVIVTILSTLTPPPPPTPPPSLNGTSSSTSTSTATSHQTVARNANISTEEPITDLPTDQTINELITTQGFNTDLPTTGLVIDEGNTTTSITTSNIEEVSTLATSSSPSISNSSDGMETMEPTSLSTVDVMNNDTMLMTTTGDALLTNEVVTYINPGFEDLTTAASDEGIFTESFLRLIIIAGASAGSCIILLIVVFIIVCCCHRRRQRKKNARYYEFKKKDFSSKYEKVEQRNSLARRDRADGSTPIGGGWVFNSSGYHGDYEDETTPNVALRSISPLAVATPLLKVQTIEDQNGVPDSGHGGSITADDSAFGLSPSLEEDIEMELNPLYKALGTSIGTGSEVRDHSYIGGDSDTISEGNEPVNDAPIRNVLLNSFGANRGEEAVEL